MAQFNPPISPTNDPSYTRDSRAIDVAQGIQPRGVEQNQIMPKGVEMGDRSAEYLGKAEAYRMEGEASATKGLGDLFSGIVGIGDFLMKGADTLIKKDIERKVYDIGKAEQEMHTARLESIVQQGATGNTVNTGVGDASSSDTEFSSRNKSVFDAQTAATTPQELQNLPNELAALEGSRAAGKIPQLYYTQRLLTQAKDLRAKYPMYRQYIDDQFQKVTGMDPANARIQALQQSINAQLTSRQNDQNKAMQLVISRLGYSSGGVTGPQALEMVKNNQWTLTDTAKWAAPIDKMEADLKLRAAVRADNKGSREEQAAQAETDATVLINYAVANSTDSLMANTGMTSAENVRNLIARGGVNETQARELGRQLELGRSQLRANLQKRMYEGGRDSLAAKIGDPNKVNNLINTQLQDYNEMIELIKNKDYGSAYELANWNKSKQQEAVAQMYKDSKIGTPTLQFRALREVLGDAAFSAHIGRDLMRTYNAQFAQYVKGVGREFDSQSMRNQTGQNFTYNDAFDELAKRGITDKRAASDLINRVNSVTDRNTPDPVKENIAAAAFDPKNRKFISRLNADGVDSNGRPIPGQQSTFNNWTSPDMTQEMRRLGNAKPTIWNNYVGWAEDTFGNELLPREIQNLGQLQNDKSIQIRWDSDNKRFEVRTSMSPEEQMRAQQAAGGQGYLQRVNQTRTILNRLNMGLYNMKNIAEASGQDVDAYLLRTVQNAGGYQLGPNVEIAQQLRDAIVTSRLRQETDKNANRSK